MTTVQKRVEIPEDVYNQILRNSYLIKSIRQNLIIAEQLGVPCSDDLGVLCALSVELTELYNTVTDVLREFRGILKWDIDVYRPNYIIIYISNECEGCTK